ncbi:MAG: fructose-bisphosphate aldolase class I [Actinomycetota bacterium]|nr:fructose-bisphosphate aldolase class I [Actinomycetota bacterium]
MAVNELHETARAIVADHKGILAADESTGTIKKRFDSIEIESTEENRRFYRQLLFTAPGIEESIGGVILYDETIRQSADDGTSLAELLASKGVIPGIKVDTGAHDHAGYPGEKVTEGLDGLRARLEQYRSLGARFAKWRAVITIGDGIPTDGNIHANAHALARYAALCQEAGIVPIVEPEVLMDADNTLDECWEVTTRTLHETFDALYEDALDLQGLLLKPNMVVSGKGCAQQATSEEIAHATVNCFQGVVPAAVPGIVFLSGGQSEVQATENLNAINQIGGPWTLSYSYGRALQASALEAWAGDPANAEAAQEVFTHRARMNSLAVAGEWRAEMEQTVTV